MGIRFILMVNRYGETRFAQYYQHLSRDEKRALEGEIIRKCLARTRPQCSFIKHQNYKIVYRRYVSLFFLVGIDNDELEHDIMFHLEKIHCMLEEMVINGCIVGTNKSSILTPIQLRDKRW